MTTNTYSPIPLVNRILTSIVACTTQDAVTGLARSMAADLRLLAPADLALVRGTALARRVTLALGATAIRFATPDLEISYPADPVPMVSTAEPTPSGSLTDTLATIATDSARMAAVPARRGNRAPIRAQSAAQIALATRQARAAGQRLAGYDGRIVDPGQGLGTVIAFGSAIVEYDPVSDRDRQALIRWADVESARTVLGLPAGAFGRAPGLPGILGDATGILNHGGYVARHVRTGGQYATAWKIGHFDSRLDSESLGKREALITLSHAGEIACNAPDHPGAAAVLADFDRRVAETLIPSDDLQRRVIACLESHFGARDTDLGLYVSPYHASKALDLIVAIRPIAGRKIRAWSHTDRESIADALCDSFAADLGRLESDVAKKADDLRKLAGASLIERCERLRAECEGLAAILGSDATASYRARIQACDAAITSALDATSQRFAMLDLS